MAGAVLRAVLAESRRRPGSQIALALAVITATAFVAASLLLTGSGRSAIERELTGTPEAAAAVVLPADGARDVPAEVAEAVATTQGVTATAPFATATAVRSNPGAPDDGQPWSVTTGVPGALARFTPVAGALPVERGQTAVAEQTARRAGVGLGSEVTLVGADGKPVRLTVVGLVATRVQLLDTALVTPEAMAQLAGAGPTQIDVLGPAGPALVAALAAAVGDRARVVDGAQQRSAELVAQMGGLDAVFAVLAVFGLAAALAAALTTTCVLGTTTDRRRRGVRLLNRLGAGRSRILGALLTDAAIVGVVGGACGAGLGYLLVHLAGVWARDAAGVELAVPALTPALVGGCVAAAVLTMVLAAAGPVVRVTGAAQASGSLGETLRGRYAGAAATAVIGTIACGRAASAPSPEIALVLVALAGVAGFVTVAAVGPVLLPGAAAAAGWILTPALGPPGRIAARSVLRAPGRASTTATALVLASMLLSAVLVGLASTTTSVHDRIAVQYPAAVTVTATGDTALPADLATRLAARPEVAAAAPVLVTTIDLGGGRPVPLGAVDVRAFPPLLEAGTEAGSLADLGPGSVVLDRAKATELGLGTGDTLRLTGPTGPVELTVAAVFRSSTALQSITVHPADMARLAETDPPIRQVLVAPRDGVDVDTLLRAVGEVAVPRVGTVVQAAADLRAELDGLVGLVTAVGIALAAGSALVAVVGVAVAMVLSVRERREETALLSALGSTRTQIVAALGAEHGLLALSGVGIGGVLGVALGVLAVRILGESPRIPAGQLGVAAAVLVGAAVLAGSLPALRTRRTR